MYAYPDDRLPLPEVHAPQRRKADHEPCPNKAEKRTTNTHNPPTKNNKTRPSGSGEQGEGGGQSE